MFIDDKSRMYNFFNLKNKDDLIDLESTSFKRNTIDPVKTTSNEFIEGTIFPWRDTFGSQEEFIAIGGRGLLNNEGIVSNRWNALNTVFPANSEVTLATDITGRYTVPTLKEFTRVGFDKICFNEDGTIKLEVDRLNSMTPVNDVTKLNAVVSIRNSFEPLGESFAVGVDRGFLNNEGITSNRWSALNTAMPAGEEFIQGTGVFCRNGFTTLSEIVRSDFDRDCIITREREDQLFSGERLAEIENIGRLANHDLNASPFYASQAIDDDRIAQIVDEAMEHFGRSLKIDQSKINIESFAKTYSTYNSTARHGVVNIVMVNFINVEGDVSQNDIRLNYYSNNQSIDVSH